jgi:hypothetical protein
MNGFRPSKTGDKLMASNTLSTSMEAIKLVWGALSSDVVAACVAHLEALLKAPDTEDWLATLHRDAPVGKELYRDDSAVPPDGRDRTGGFMLLAHTEYAGLYRPPHDHGRGWVIYAVQRGEIEMCSYARTINSDGSVELVKRDSRRVAPGQIQVYLPGDIHDTRCTTGPALLLRFTDRDLKIEDQQLHRVTRYVEKTQPQAGAERHLQNARQGTVWTVRAAT